MEFKTEFFPLLNKALYKEKNDIPEHIVKNGDIFLMDRYASFYNPSVAQLINKTLNRYLLNFTKKESGEYLYELLKSIVPPLNKAYIPYVSKQKSNFVKNADKFVSSYAERHNMSEREIWGMIYQLDNLR